MNYWIEILQLITICFVLSDMASFISELFYDILVDTKNKGVKLLLSLFAYILSCPKCFSFWLSILFTGSLFTAALVALTINILKWLQYKYVGGETKL